MTNCAMIDKVEEEAHTRREHRTNVSQGNLTRGHYFHESGLTLMTCPHRENASSTSSCGCCGSHRHIVPKQFSENKLRVLIHTSKNPPNVGSLPLKRNDSKLHPSNIVSLDGMMRTQDYTTEIEEIQHLLSPTFILQLRAFLGRITYYG